MEIRSVTNSAGSQSPAESGVSIGARRFGIGMGRAERIVQILEGQFETQLGSRSIFPGL